MSATANEENLGSRETVLSKPWASRFAGQFWALFQKNLLLNIRNLRAFVLQLLTPFLALCLVLLIDASLRANEKQQRQFKNELDPVAEQVTPIPNCIEDLYITDSNCKSFLYSPARAETDEKTNEVIQDVVDAIKESNRLAGKPLEVERFLSPEDIDDYLLENPETALGAVIFDVELSSDDTVKRIDFTLQFNSTPKFFKGTFQDPNMFFAVPMQMATHREIHRYFLEKSGRAQEEDKLDWAFAYKPFAHPALESSTFVAQFASAFIFAAAMFNFVVTLSAIVSEREAGLRQALRTMGMLDSAHWASWVAYQTIMAVVLSLVTMASGHALQFDIFRKNDFGLFFTLLLLFTLAMSSIAFVLSTLLKRSTSATNLAFFIFIVGWIMQSFVTQFPYTSSGKEEMGGLWYVIFSLFPWCLLGKALADFDAASATAESPGLAWSERFSYCNDIGASAEESAAAGAAANRYIDNDCVMPIGTILEILAIEFFAYLLLALYLDNVLKNENGVRRPLWYLFTPGYWNLEFMGTTARVGPSPQGLFGRVPNLVRPPQRDEDVEQEELLMREKLKERTGIDEDPGLGINIPVASIEHPAAVEVYGLRQWFGANFQAVKNSWFQVEEGQLFCLLGPNGAGKSTTINCLTGNIPPSGGDALIHGDSLTAPGGVDRIRGKIGVCPQFDVLWDRLTGREHLEIYGRVKGIDPAVLPRETRELLSSVKLLDAASIRTGSYSGGMKRRLSVAIALLGNPKVVYLDEPTTGMDPISRRHVWDIIEKAKSGRAIILTTHSMEEADILGDRIAIMARGNLRCIGSSLRLKSKFGTGYSISVSLQGTRDQPTGADERFAARVKDFFKEGIGADVADETKAYIQFQIPKDKEGMLPGLLQQLKAEGPAMGVGDVQVALTSLEEVFLRIVREAELEDSTGSRQVELADGLVVEVPIGAETVRHPASGEEYTVRWVQDEAGDLQVLDAQPASRSG
uniref:Abc transporter a family member 2-like n=2 Tax=Tetraselmis sp. GSL018 TaxID=582737 RepID=A0A061SDE8_9CHLO|mmetsp:Transcript_25747/g.61329  ORF Transcript_25747/g.61329 Transcript_25747/m.61329 type:complete len:973 (-) Transcript_25747:1959-4877(-)